MVTSHRLRSTAGLVAGTTLLAALVACGDDDSSGNDDTTGSGGNQTSAVPDAAAAGAAWLASQLTKGALYNDQYQTDDFSTTVELAYALRAVDPDFDGSPVEADISAALEAGVEEYALPGKEVYAGSLGKLVSYATDAGADPADFGGVDLVTALEDRTADDGVAQGRISDVSEYGDYANSFGQAWAVRGLTQAGSDEAAAARDFLLLQQCSDGYLRQDFSKPTADDQSCDAAGAESSTDATALAVVLLHDVAEDDDELATALDAAVDWLIEQQADDGSYVGSSQLPTNSNSTGLAGWALHVAGESEAAAAAADWVLAHQVSADCAGGLEDADGAIAYDERALAAAADKGITAKTAYQWRLATAQALPALLAAPADAEPAACRSS